MNHPNELIIIKYIIMISSKKSWYQRMVEHQFELQDLINTRSFIPFNKLTDKNRNYTTHSNGDQPFKIVANKTGIKIYENTIRPRELIFEFIDFMGYWTGFDSSPDQIHGNSVLIKISNNKYVSVGHDIYSFETDEKILDYVSPIGNNDVPYPVAFGENNVYFMLDKLLIGELELELEVTVANAYELYREFYGHIGSKKGKHNKTPMKNVVVLHKQY